MRSPDSSSAQPGTASWLHHLLDDPRLAPSLSPQLSAGMNDPKLAHRIGTAAEAVADALGYQTGLPNDEMASSYQRLQGRLAHSRRSSRPGKRQSRVPYASLVAGAALVGVAGWGLSHWSGASVDSIPQEYSTQRGERTQVTLPDGSTVILAPASRLQLSSRFGSDQRAVTLEGQAYFTIRDDAKRSFVVVAGGSTTKVLGTAFSVRAYQTDAIPQIAVAEGKVAFAGKAGSVVLLAGDVGELRENGTPRVTHDARIGQVFGWIRGQLVYENTPLRDIVADLERMYDIDIYISSPEIAELPLRAVLSGDRVDEVLNTVALALNIKVQREGKVVTMSSLSERSTQSKSNVRGQL